MSTQQIPLSSTPRSRSLSRTQHPHPSRSPRSLSRSRPTTPLRPSSRNSLRSSQNFIGDFPLDSLEAQFAELSDGMADLEANMMNLQLMHESLARFSEGFASFLYGLSVNAFCVDFPEAPVQESFRRAREKQRDDSSGNRATSQERYGGDHFDGETTFMTTDTSFVDNPPQTVSSKSTATPKKLVTPKPVRTTGVPGRGGTAGRGRGAARGARGSGLPAPRGRASGLPARSTRS